MDRIASDFLLTKLIARAVAGEGWPDHPLARQPDRVLVSETGAPTFHYSSPRAAYSVLDDDWLIETRVRGSLVEHTTYGPTGRVLARDRGVIGEPRWN